MKRLLVSLFILLVFIYVANVTVPDRMSHRKAMVSILSDGFRNGLSDAGDGGNVDWMVSKLGDRFSFRVVGDQLVYDDRFLYSVGRLGYIDRGEKVVSIGLFGHVYVRRDLLLSSSFPVSYPDGSE